MFPVHCFLAFSQRPDRGLIYTGGMRSLEQWEQRVPVDHFFGLDNIVTEDGHQWWMIWQQVMVGKRLIGADGRL